MVHAVIFDLDNTLYSYDRAHAAAFAALKTYAFSALGLSEERFEALHEQASREIRERSGGGPVIHNRLIRFQQMLEQAGLPIRCAPAMAELYWTALLGAMEPESGVLDCFAALRRMGLRLGIGTNMQADRQFSKLERLGLAPYVDFLVSSEEVGKEKPAPELFLCCAQKAGCAPEDCVFVGDSLKNDALGAAAAGLRGVWYRPDGRAQSVPEGILLLSALDRLPALILELQEDPR